MNIVSDEENYCGCCGDVIADHADASRMWCGCCLKHLGPAIINNVRIPAWERTYQACVGVPCPFSVTA